MRRAVVVAVLVSALVGVVGAESIIKAKNATLPKGSISVEEIETVMVQAPALNGAENAAMAAGKPSQTIRGTTYAMY
jgi:hypothetical protein